MLEKKGYDARSVLLYGPDRATELIAHLKRDPVDLLVVGSHGHGLIRDLLWGQTVDKVRHGLEIPMLIARPDRVGFPADPVEDAPQSSAREAALGTAATVLDGSKKTPAANALTLVRDFL